MDHPGDPYKAVIAGGKPAVPTTDGEGTDGGRSIPPQVQVAVGGVEPAKAIILPLPFGQEGSEAKLRQ